MGFREPALVAIVLCHALAGCTDAVTVRCGKGEFHSVDGHSYCVYDPSDIAPGAALECPAELPNNVAVGTGFVCTDDRSAASAGDIPASACRGAEIAALCGAPALDAGPPPPVDAAPDADAPPPEDAAPRDDGPRADAGDAASPSTTCPALPSDSGPAPAGATIAFTSDRDGDDEIYVMNGDGTDQRRLTNRAGADWMPRWSRDGRRIAYLSARQIRVMNADGSDDGVVATCDGEGCGSFTWSPDDSYLYFHRDMYPATCRAGIFRVRVVPGAPIASIEEVWNVASATYYPDLSPDGTKLLVAQQRGCWSPSFDIMVTPQDRVGMPWSLLRPDPDASLDAEPRWSPDGCRVVWTHVTMPGGFEVSAMEMYSMAHDGSDVRRLTSDSFHDGGPCFTADGAHIVYASLRDSWEIMIMNSDGTDARNLTSNASRDLGPDCRWR